MHSGARRPLVLRLHYDLASVERGPLPPHERTWRHPSELAAEERAEARAEPAAPSTRVFALTTGMVGLLAVGVLIVTISPQRQASPIAISASTTPVTIAVGTADDADPRVAAPNALSSTGSTRPAALTESRQPSALATPIGDGRLAFVTGRSIGDHSSEHLDVRVASGEVIEAEIVSPMDDTVVVVALAHGEPGRVIARHRPADHEMVTVMSESPVTVAYADVGTLAVHEGTAVVDGNGALVGLCSRSRAGASVHLIDVTEVLGAATTGGR